MKHVAISLIIPTKNEEKYLGRTLAQFAGLLDRHSLEIIVSDAHSTDRTQEIALAFQSSYGDRFRLVSVLGPQNIAMGRNLGAAHATGEILFHLDADVRIPHPDRFFEKVRDAFRNPHVAAASAPLWVYPEEARLADRLYHLGMNLLIRLSFTAGLYLSKGECQLVRREAFERVGGYAEKLVAGEDCNLFYRLHKVGRIAYLHRLKVYHSPRRFRRYGYLWLTFIYLREGLWMFFKKRSYAREWTPVR